MWILEIFNFFDIPEIFTKLKFSKIFIFPKELQRNKMWKLRFAENHEASDRVLENAATVKAIGWIKSRVRTT